MFGDGSLTFREFAMREPHPLAVIHDAVLEFLRGRNDAVLFGAQAVNAYVAESRMTQDVDIASPHARRNWRRNCGPSLTSVSTSPCAFDGNAEAALAIASIRCASPRTAIWSMCGRLPPCRRHSG